MKIVIAIDSFKGCASSTELAQAIERGIRVVYPQCEVIVCPVADGGEGTVEALAGCPGATTHTLTCSGPLGDPVEAVYTVLKDGTAVIEMAAASGLPLIPEEKRDPRITSTFGTGELIRDAIERGSRDFIVGIGGSATNDAGLGMLQSLGYRFLDNRGDGVGYAKDLSKIVRIDASRVLPELQSCRFRVACDVTNPLYGPNGASHIYGPQKGADPEMVRFLDKELRAFASLVAEATAKDVSNVPGTGAAGGLGYGFLSFMNATLESGIKIILEKVGLRETVEGADFLITGEGKIDRQSAMGKVIDGIGSVCLQAGLPCIALAGSCAEATCDVHAKGVTSVFSILPAPMPLAEAMDREKALTMIQNKSEQLFRLIKRVSG